MTKRKPAPSKPLRGFAAMSPERRAAISSLGGKAVKPENRTFFRDRTLASKAGHIGGKAADKSKRTFATNPDTAKSAGRKGGLATAAKRS